MRSLFVTETWADGDTAQPARISTDTESHIRTYIGKLLAWPYRKLWAIMQMKERVNDKREKVVEGISYRIQGKRKYQNVSESIKMSEKRIRDKESRKSYNQRMMMFNIPEMIKQDNPYL